MESLPLRIALLPFLLLLPAAVAACSDDDDPVGPDDDLGAIAGMVEDEGGSGVAGAGVTITATDGTDRTATSGSDGSFGIDDLEPGSWSVDVAPPAGYQVEEAPATVTVSAGETSDLTVVVAPDPDAGEVQEVYLQGDLTFSPSEVTVEPGTTVRWVSQDDQFHTVTPDGHDEWSEAQFNQPGDTFEHTFQEEGEFDYFCAPHVDQGMVGTITVDAGGGDDGSGY